MVRTEPDVDPESFTTDRLVDYINDVAPIAAHDDTPDVLRANAEAAIEEFRARKTAPVATDGGEPAATVDDVVDDDAPDWLTHVADEANDFKIRHDRAIRTVVEDGDVVHKVVEEYDADADRDSLSFSGGYTCPCEDDGDDHDIDTEYDYDADTIRHTCEADGCPFDVVVGYRPVPEGKPTHKTPTFYRATVPDDGVEAPDIDFDDLVDKIDDDTDKSELANLARRFSLSRFVDNVRDAAYVSAEYDGDPVDDEDAEKVADAYIDTFECARCGDEYDTGAERSHPNHDDPVCRECKDDHVWGFDDADLPDDVEAVFDDYKSVTPRKFRDLLRDVKYYPAWIASGDDALTVDDAPACPTGKGAKRTVTEGPAGSSSGSGFRRADDGVAHGDSNWRYVVREARDAGLIERVDDEDDADFDDAAARWEATDKGDRVFDELARCPWCGGRLEAYRNEYTVKLSRWSTAENVDLITACPDRCRTDIRGSTETLSDAE